MDIKKIIARSEFQSLRLSKGLSMNELSKRAGVTPLIISRVEKGKPTSPATAKKICTALESRFDELFELKG